jgi:hypothetical protein
MAGFGEALKKGLEAHKRADAARKEMDDVLATASADLTQVTGVPISLRFDTTKRATRAASIFESAQGIGPPSENIIVLAAQLNSGGRAYLAEVSFGELGYPVNFRWEHRYNTATNRDSFEELLKALLAHSATGEKIAALLGGQDA